MMESDGGKYVKVREKKRWEKSTIVAAYPSEIIKPYKYSYKTLSFEAYFHKILSHL